MMIALQHGHTDACMIYDMRTNTAPYCPLFDIKTHKPIHSYYALVAFNQLYRLGSQIQCECDNNRLYALAASNGKANALMLSNLTGDTQSLSIDGVDLENAGIYELGESGVLAWAPDCKAIKNNTVMLIEW